MSDLRKHLEAAKQEYQSLRYPGNLADEILRTPRRSRIDVLIRLGAVAAIAAAIVILVRMKMNEESFSANQVAIQVPQIDEEVDPTAEDELEIEVASFGELPAMSLPQGVSEGLDLAPAAPDFSFSAPSFSLISDEQSPQSTSTTREQV